MNTQPTSNRGQFRTLLPTALAVTVGLLEMISLQAGQEQLPQEPAAGQWGISSSAGSTRNVSEEKRCQDAYDNLAQRPQWGHQQKGRC
jgi:hypothetical protein